MGTIRSIIIVALSIAFCSYANSTTFTYASIEKLPEQVISARVMTAIYDELGYGLVVKEMPGLRAQNRPTAAPLMERSRESTLMASKHPM